MKIIKGILILLVVTLFIFSCKTTEYYYVEGTEKIIIKDTLVLTKQHNHFEIDNKIFCFDIEEVRLLHIDTIEIVKLKKIPNRK
jgi:hypothetical protein